MRFHLATKSVFAVVMVLVTATASIGEPRKAAVSIQPVSELNSWICRIVPICLDIQP